MCIYPSIHGESREQRNGFFSLPCGREFAFFGEGKGQAVMADNEAQAIARLKEKLGDELFWVLTHPENLETLQPLVEQLPVRRVGAGERLYELLPLFHEEKPGGRWLQAGDGALIARGREIGASMNEEEGRYFLDHKQTVARDLRRQRVLALFPEWIHPETNAVAFIRPLLTRWDLGWLMPTKDISGRLRVLRRIK